MPAQLELLVAVLELVAFFLITPEVIGRSRLERLFESMGRLNSWLRNTWFSDDFGPVPPVSVLLIVILGSLIVAGFLGFSVPDSSSFAVFVATPLVTVPALYVLVYLALAWLHRRARLGRVLAVVGACLFVIGRVIVIASAYTRLRP